MWTAQKIQTMLGARPQQAPQLGRLPQQAWHPPVAARPQYQSPRVLGEADKSAYGR